MTCRSPECAVHAVLLDRQSVSDTTIIETQMVGELLTAQSGSRLKSWVCARQRPTKSHSDTATQMEKLNHMLWSDISTQLWMLKEKTPKSKGSVEQVTTAGGDMVIKAPPSICVQWWRTPLQDAWIRFMIDCEAALPQWDWPDSPDNHPCGSAGIE